MVASLAWIAILLPVAAGQVVNHEPLVIGQTFLAGSTNPTEGSIAWALTSHGIAEKLFTVDKEGNIVSQVAESVKKLSKFSWEVTVKNGYQFSDGTTVTAEHVGKALTELNQKNSKAQASLGSMTMTALDGSRLKIESTQATPMMEAVLAEWPFVVFLEKDNKFIFTGPFAVDTFVKGDRFDLVPNEHYDRASERRAAIPKLTIKKFADGSSVASALERGEIDMAFHLPIASLTDLRKQSGLTVKSFEVGYQYMMWHNTRRSPLSDVRVRKAVDLAIDRQELAQELRGGDPTRNLFPENTPYHFEEPDPIADKSAAEQQLVEAGWTKNGTGHLEKGGVPLALNIVAYPQRPGLVTMLPVIEQKLAALGMTVNTVVTSGTSWDQLDNIIASNDFDLMLWAQHTLPAGDPQWFLNAFFRSDAGSNHAGLNSTTIDGLIDDLAHTETLEARKTATEKACTAILQEVPVSILVTPAWHVAFGTRLSAYDPWGSDYYIVRADLGVGPAPTPAKTPGPSEEVSSACHVIFSGLVLTALSLNALL